MAFVNPNKIAPIQGPLIPEDFLDYILKHNDGENPQFGVRPNIEAKLGGPLSLRVVEHVQLLKEIKELICRFNYGKPEDKTGEYYKTFPAWSLANKAGGHGVYQNIVRKEKLKNELKETQEHQIRELDVTLKTDQVTKLRNANIKSNIAIIISVILLLLELAKLIIPK